MGRIFSTATFLTISLSLFAGNAASPCLGQKLSYRMPEYADSEPPPPRTREEVAKILAGSGEAAAESAESTGPLRIVLVAGPKDHDKGEHDYPAWQKVWSRLLAKADATKVDTAWEFPSPEQVDRADVLVFYQRGRWDEDRAAAIDPFLARGGGLVYIHWAVDGRGQQDEMAKRIGLASLGGGIRFRHGELNIDFSPAAEHPIARNFSNIRWVDESYWQLSGDASRINLLGTSLEDGQPQPQFWTVERGRGRVFVSIPGHYMWTFDDPAFRTLQLRGIAWAGRRNIDRFNELVTLDARVQ
jgi:type 1 glutamine amidotransferase